MLGIIISWPDIQLYQQTCIIDQIARWYQNLQAVDLETATVCQAWQSKSAEKDLLWVKNINNVAIVVVFLVLLVKAAHKPQSSEKQKITVVS